MTPHDREKIAERLKTLMDAAEHAAVVLPPKIERTLARIAIARDRLIWGCLLICSAMMMVVGWCMLLVLMLDMGRVLPALLDGNRPAAVEVVQAIALWLGCQLQWRFRRTLYRPWGMKKTV